MRVALLAAFPLHELPGFSPDTLGHFASWLPQISACFEQAAGFDIHWLVITRAPVDPAPLRWQGQTFHLLHNPHRFRLLRGYPDDSRLIRERLEQIQPDLVHAWGTEDCYAMAGARCGFPWVLSMQGIYCEYLRRVRMHPLNYVQGLQEAFLLRRAREITVESHWGANIIRRLAPQARMHLVEYGVQPHFFEHTWAPEEGRPVALFAGTTMDGRKGVQDVVAAFRAPELAGSELLICGDRVSRHAQKLERESSANVRWLGRVSGRELAGLLTRAWCLVLPTRADTSPNVVKEARVIGLPVITTPHGGQSDYIADGVNGYLVEPGAIPALTARLARVLGDYQHARQLGAARHAEQRAFFRPERTAELFLELYRQLKG